MREVVLQKQVILGVSKRSVEGRWRIQNGESFSGWAKSDKIKGWNGNRYLRKSKKIRR